MSSTRLSPTAESLVTPPGLSPSQRDPSAITWRKSVVLALALVIVGGFALRVKGLGSIGFAEDEINKLEAVQAYDHGDFSVNAEHPMLMKVMMDLSLRTARALNSAMGGNISEEAALRFPNVIFGALTAIPLFLLTAALFDRRTAIWAAALWSFGVNAITYNRIGKEDTLMVFFLLFAFYFFIRAKQVDTRQSKTVKRLLNLSAISFGLMLASKYFPHYFGLNMLYHHKMQMREREPAEPRFKTPLSFYILIGITFLIANPGFLLPSVWTHLNAYSAEKLVPHTGYIIGNTVFHNRMSNSPFWGLPGLFLRVVHGDQDSARGAGGVSAWPGRMCEAAPATGPAFCPVHVCPVDYSLLARGREVVALCAVADALRLHGRGGGRRGLDGLVAKAARKIDFRGNSFRAR